MKRHIGLTITALAALVLVLVLFWPGKSGQKASTIRLIGEALPPLEALEALSTKFTAETGISVIVEQYAAQEVHQKVMSDVVAGTGTYDLVLQPHKHLGRLVETGYLRSLGALGSELPISSDDFDPYTDLFENWWHEISCYNTQVYGVPFSALTMYLWYRKDLFDDPQEQAAFQEKYGYPLQVPEYWDQYRDVAEFFTRPSKNFYGTAVQGKRHDALWYEFLNFLYAFGGNILDTEHGWEYGDIVINSPEAIQALDFYVGLVQFSPTGTLNYTWDDALAVMQQDRVAMVIMWNDSTYAVEYSKDSLVAGKMGFAMIPKSRDVDKRFGQLEGWSYLIPKNSPHPEAAISFIAWMMKPANQIEQHLNGGASALKATYDDSQVQKLSYTNASLETMAVAIPKPTIPEGPEMTEILTRELSLALSQQETPKEALDRTAQEYKRILGPKSNLRYPVQE